MKLRHNAAPYVASGFVMIIPGIALLEATMRDGPARVLLLVIAAVVSAILATAFVWSVILTKTEVTDHDVIVTTPAKVRRWRLPEDVTAIEDGGTFYVIRFAGPAGAYKFTSGIYCRDGSFAPLDEVVARARTKTENA